MSDFTDAQLYAISNGSDDFVGEWLEHLSRGALRALATENATLRAHVERLRGALGDLKELGVLDGIDSCDCDSCTRTRRARAAYEETAP